MDQETPSTSEKAVRFRAHEEVALVETVECGGPEYATATQRRRRRRRRHVMRNSARSPRFAFSFCLLAIVNILFVYWLAKYYVLVKETNSTQDTTTGRIILSSVVRTKLTQDSTTGRIILSSVVITKLTTTTEDLQCKVKYRGYKVDGWCYMEVDMADECQPPFTFSTLFERGIKAATTLKKYVIRKKSRLDMAFHFAAIAYCSGGRITKIEYYNETEIDRKKYKEYFNFDDNYECWNTDTIVMQFGDSTLFRVGGDSVQNGGDLINLCEFKL